MFTDGYSFRIRIELRSGSQQLEGQCLGKREMRRNFLAFSSEFYQLGFVSPAVQDPA